MRFRSFVCAGAFLMLAGCARQGAFAPTAPNASTAAREATSAFRIIHQFKGAPSDGQRPVAHLTETNGSLYGTTELGGADNRGAAFEIPAGGTERLVYSFSAKDHGGVVPQAGLLGHMGGLFGTTSHGGTDGGGTVYRLASNGMLHVLYNFTRERGAGPRGDLIFDSGDLYGTTEFGGAHDMGTVFKISNLGRHRILHSFAGGTDGAHPRAGLDLLGGKLYGTTYDGGANDMGTVFEVTTDGAERVVHSFAGKPQDGKGPQCTLVALNGSLYGTTVTGGSLGMGTIFEVKRNGAERILLDFDGQNGQNPLAGLTVFNGLLYGTTSEGVSSQGEAFEFHAATGKLRVLHDFSGGDGAVPRAGLIESSGKLYGTTSGGGARLQGVVFELTP